MNNANLLLMITAVQLCGGSFRDNPRAYNNGYNRQPRRNYSHGRQTQQSGWREPPAEDWDEERQLALALQLKVIQKMSMKKWIKERHVLWPSRTTIQRLKVEEWEESRMNELRSQGWVPPKENGSFETVPRTQWIKIAEKLITNKGKEFKKPSQKENDVVEL
jgi:hypothetical protein